MQDRLYFVVLTAECSFLIPHVHPVHPVYHFIYELQFRDRLPLQMRPVQIIVDMEVARSAKPDMGCDAIVNRKPAAVNMRTARLHQP